MGLSTFFSLLESGTKVGKLAPATQKYGTLRLFASSHQKIWDFEILSALNSGPKVGKLAPPQKKKKNMRLCDFTSFRLSKKSKIAHVWESVWTVVRGCFVIFATSLVATSHPRPSSLENVSEPRSLKVIWPHNMYLYTCVLLISFDFLAGSWSRSFKVNLSYTECPTAHKIWNR